MIVRRGANFYFWNGLLANWYETEAHHEDGEEWITLTSRAVTNPAIRDSLEEFRMKLEAKNQ